MTNIQKYQLVKELSPVYSANEIAELTGLTQAQFITLEGNISLRLRRFRPPRNGCS